MLTVQIGQGKVVHTQVHVHGMHCKPRAGKQGTRQRRTHGGEDVTASDAMAANPTEAALCSAVPTCAAIWGAMWQGQCVVGGV